MKNGIFSCLIAAGALCLLGRADAVTTASLQAEIDRVSAAGGGCVTVPPGEWTVGTLWLKSGVELHLEKGAVLKASANLDDYNAPDAYPQNFGSAAEGWSAKHLIIAHEAENVAVTGPGVIDGHADAFMAEPDAQMRIGDFCWRHGYLNARDRAHAKRPGQMLVFVESKGIRIADVTLRNMPMWTCFLHGCENAAIGNVTISNDLRHANTDGFDIDSGRHVTVSNCTITTGDDAFAIRGAPARLKDRSRVCEDIRISDCTCACSASGVRVGVGDGAIRNVRFRNIRFREAGHGLLVQSCYPEAKYTGVAISDVSFENVTLDDCSHAIVVTAGTDKADTVLEKVTFRNVSAAMSGSVVVEGAGKTRPRDITFEGLKLRLVPPARPRSTTKDWQIVGAGNLFEAAIVKENADNVVFRDVSVTRDPALGPERARDFLE